MSSFKIAEKAKKPAVKRPLPKAGTLPARLLHVVDLGVQKQPDYMGEPKPDARQVMFTFELPSERMDYNGEDVPLRISSREYTVSKDPKSNLFKFMNGIDPMNQYEGDLAKYLNLPCFVSIAHKEVPGKAGGEKRTFANITSVMPAPEGVPVKELHDRPTLFSFDAPTCEDLLEIPKWIRDKMALATNYHQIKEVFEAVGDKTAKGDKPAEETSATEVTPATQAPKATKGKTAAPY